jgi:hypothetical protein
MALKFFNFNIVKLFSNLNSTHLSFAPNIISSVSYVLPYASCTLMGFTTFLVVHFNHSTTLGFTNECMVPKSNKQKTMFQFYT